MSSRVYLLFDILEEKFPCVIQALQKSPMVAAVDELEGHPNIMVIIEARDRQQLVDMIMPVLDSVDRVTKDVRLLINQETRITPLRSDNKVKSLQTVC
jgi:hypothetical protein